MKAYQFVIRNYWNWLPGFRSVAETEHLPTAAARSHLTAAALSRTVRLLEEELERPLFQRRGRRLHLNEDGRIMLEAVRMAMRIVHDAHQSIGGRRFEGSIRVAAGGLSRVYAMAGILDARQQYPGLVPYLMTPDPATVVQQLLSGDLDLALGSFVLRSPGLRTELLTYATSAVYCGPKSPLYGREEVAMEELVQQPFTAPPAGPGGQSNDGWPSEIHREVHLVVDRLETGMKVCANTELLAVLPDALAAASALSLHRLPVGESIPKTPVVAIYREPTGADDLVSRLLEHFRAAALSAYSPGGEPAVEH